MKNKQGFAPIVIILIVVGILAVAGGVYVVTQQILKQKTPPQTQQSINQPTSSGKVAKSQTQSTSTAVDPCINYGGKLYKFTECDNITISDVCILSNGGNCYLEDIKKGNCEGELKPKVLCDSYKSENKNSFIKVISPNGGEVWEIGKTYTIRWSSSDDVKSVSILLECPADNQMYITDDVVNNGSYNWTIPLSFPVLPVPFNQCIISISSIGYRRGNIIFAGPYAGDESDSPFSIVK